MLLGNSAFYLLLGGYTLEEWYRCGACTKLRVHTSEKTARVVGALHEDR